MSDDWAKKYVDIHKQKQQEKRDVQERARLARVVAPDMFQRIKNRVQHDLKTFHDAGVLQSLHFNDIDAQKFTVNDMTPHSSPSGRPTVGAMLDIIVVQYVYLFPKKAGEETAYDSTGALRICSDFSGVAQVYRNGNGGAFADESEVSEFLLKPLLDYIDSQ